MSTATDLRRYAARCLRMAAAAEDRVMAADLVALAADFSAQADEVDPSLREAGGTAARDLRAGRAQT
jgi:hypothetical protein